MKWCFDIWGIVGNVLVNGFVYKLWVYLLIIFYILV